MLRLVPAGTTPDLSPIAAAVADWLAEYPNPRTRERYGESLAGVIRHTGAHDPSDLTVAAVAAWLERKPRANNTVRADVTAVRAFLAWCAETGQLAEHRDRPFRRLLASYPATYGKVQAANPAVRMTKDEYDRLIAVCQDGTDSGLRDELLVRLGVSGGMRTFELLSLTVGMVRRAPELAWTGKRNKARTATAGPALVAVIAEYLARYEAAKHRPLEDSDPLFCPARHSRYYPDQLLWGRRITTTAGIRQLLQRRARLAGFAHLSPHDLKRSAARMMHEARSADGGHLFDLLEISEVLDHSNPKVTKDCYIGPLDHAAKDRAAALFG
jgi:integrase